MSTTPPTSPPPAVAQTIEQPAEKRSREQMSENVLTPDSQATENPLPSGTLPQPLGSASPAKSGRRSPKKTAVNPELSPQGPTRNATQQQAYTLGGSSHTRSSDDSTQLDSHPKRPIEPFDWDEFEGRFADAMGKIKAKEDLLYDEFNEMIQVCF
jgi:hypothetical protein